MRFGELELDRAGRQLLRGGHPVRLSPKAFALLELLLERRPAAVSKAEIRDRVWPQTFVADSNLTSLVTELRTLLKDVARKPRFIRTVYGYGYAFCEPASRPREQQPHSLHRYRLFGDGREIALAEGDTLLGRADDVDVLVDAPSVSRRHARLRISGARATLEDLGSKNGTRVNGIRLSAAFEMKDGMEFCLGYVPFTFRILRSGTESTQTTSRFRK